MMKNVKLLFVFMSFILVFGTVLMGCSKGTTTNKETASASPAATATATAAAVTEAPTVAPKSNEVVTIKFSGWGEPAEKKIYEGLIKDFESKNPDIKVQYNHIPADYAGKLNTMLAGGEAPDVFYVGDGDFARWAKLGLLLDVEEKVKTSGLDTSDMFPSALTRYKFDGQKSGSGDLYALPMDVAGTVLYYNKKLFDAAGVTYPSAETPMTFDQLIETSKKLTKDTNGDGKIDQWGMGPIWWEGFIWGNGGQILSPDRKSFVMNEDKAAQAMQFAADLRNVHKVSPDSTALKSMGDGQMFETGKLAMIISGRWATPGWRKLTFDWDVAPIPANGQWTGWSGSAGFATYSKTKYPDQAFKFAAYLAGPDANKIRGEAGLTMPVYKTMANTDVFLNPGQKPAHAQVFLKAVEMEQPGPWTYVPNNKWSDIVNQNLDQIWSGKKTAKALLDEIKPQVEKALKEGNPELFK